ncbi:RNA-binding S4 domain-containing protein [Arcanobacterium phocisimile]|uniref:Heat shock protein Hsp15 n=2 Tax=Arcanobacterium TaxID=28263 RepID=A0A1H2LM54_9ACTO|nr:MULTISPECIES: RNA-binding S4 domain-containing protein [Arcanobacterium]QRV02703.1 RNA-binding S4 domain-containing protein [Arcanobacterium phocisimile]SDU82077.1 heat shock protein Hsp15 [Arcanobacterium phocae]
MSETVRIDVWLWSVRQTKTRSLATNECKAGHVRINGNVAKPSSPVKIGDEVRYRFQGFDRILQVTRLLTKRSSATQAQACYIDKSPQRPKVYIPVFTRERGAGRPTKKERRELDRILGRNSNYGHMG